MLERLSERTFRRWQALFYLKPWGPDRDDYRFGLLCTLVHNGLFQGDRLKPSDFFPNLPGEDGGDINDSPELLQKMFEARAQAEGWEVVKPS